MIRMIKKVWSLSLIAESYFWGFMDSMTTNEKLKDIFSHRAIAVGLASAEIWD